MLFIVVCLILSLALNGVLFWYAHKSAKKMSFLSENLSFLYTLIDTFLEHTKTVYELEQIYGDQQVKNLVQHAYALREQVGGMLETYDITTRNLQQELEFITLDPADSESEDAPEEKGN